MFFKRRGTSPGPDFSGVDSSAKAEALHSSGELQKVLLLPTQFGGRDIAQNVVYLTTAAAEMKAQIDLNIVRPLIASGKVSRYQAIPEYQGRSFVPIRILISATEPGSYSARVGVWGNGLNDADVATSV